MQMMSLTQQQRRLFDFIANAIDRTGVCPSYDEMRQHLGLHSKSGVHGMVARLEERGYVRRLPERERALEILQRPPETSDRAEALRKKLLAILQKEALSASLSVVTVRQLISTTRV
jgi:repressor LexA